MPRNGAAESFVSFIPLFDGAALSYADARRSLDAATIATAQSRKYRLISVGTDMPVASDSAAQYSTVRLVDAHATCFIDACALRSASPVDKRCSPAPQPIAVRCLHSTAGAPRADRATRARDSRTQRPTRSAPVALQTSAR